MQGISVFDMLKIGVGPSSSPTLGPWRTAQRFLAELPSASRSDVSLDTVIRTMWQTALDMNDKYQETSEGGLAVQIAVNVSEC